MTPELSLCFSLSLIVGTPTIVSRSPEYGKRQLIPILSGTLSGALSGHVLPGGVDSQVIDADGLCRLSARYAVETGDGDRFYIENNGLRRIPAAWRSQLFDDDLAFFSEIPPGEIYFRTTPQFEVYSDRLRWLTENLFIASGVRRPGGLDIHIYQVK